MFLDVGDPSESVGNVFGVGLQCRPASMINHNILQYDKSARKRARRGRAFLNHQNDKIMINHYDKFNASTVGWNRVICPVHRALRSGCVFLFNSLRFTLCMHRFNVHIRFHGNFVQKPHSPRHEIRASK